MDEPTVRIRITEQSFDEHFSIDEWMSFDNMTNKELYEKMVLFVVNEQGESVPIDEAKKLFRQVKKAEWSKYVDAFYKAVAEAFVSPTNGGS